MPFTSEQFFEVFRSYNQSVWPAQWVLSGAGVLTLLGALVGQDWWARVSFMLLGSLWLWMALAYHLAHFARVNPAAPGFAALFTIAAVVFIWRALRRQAPRFEVSMNLRSMIGALLVIYGILIYPTIGLMLGQRFPSAPGFGLPCPTTIFTIGILSFVQPFPERYLLNVPIFWAIVGSTAAIAFGVLQDYGLAVAGLWAGVLWISSGLHFSRSE